MPVPAAAIVAGGQVIGGAIDAIAQIGQNKKAREHQEYMYDKQNAYNTPAMQMQRFKQAGLNPHLIYGQGNSGNAGSPPPLTTQEAPKSNFADISQNYIANRTQQAQVDNMEKAREVMEADMILKKAQTQATLSGSAKTDQEVYQAGQLFQNVMAQSDANLRVTEQNYQTGLITQNKLETEIKQITANTRLTQEQIKSVTQSILESRARVQNLSMENKLKGTQVELNKLEVNLRKLGLNSNDNVAFRALGQLIQPDENTLGQMWKGFKKWFGTTDDGDDTFLYDNKRK
jgi:hypothetical protein